MAQGTPNLIVCVETMILLGLMPFFISNYQFNYQLVKDLWIA